LKNNYSPIQLIDSASRRSITLAAFASMLRKSKYISEFNYVDLQSLAASACNPSNSVQNELLHLIQKADKIYQPAKRKKPRKN
jgi:Ca-activated chloride channel family protein